MTSSESPIRPSRAAVSSPGLSGPPSTRGRWLVTGIELALLCCIGLGVSSCGEPEVETSGPAAYVAVASASGAIAGRSVWVRIVDRNADPIEGAVVIARLSSGEALRGTRVGPGQYRLDGLPDAAVPIDVEVAGARHRIEHVTWRPQATLVLPVGGSLEISWALPRNARLADGELILVVESRAASDVRVELPVDRDASNRGSVEIPYIAVGEYTAHLELWQLAELAAGASRVDPVTAPLLFQIQEDRLTRALLGLSMPDFSPSSALVPPS